MAAKLKSGVSYNKSKGTVTVAPGTQGVSQSTINAVSGAGVAGTAIANARAGGVASSGGTSNAPTNLQAPAPAPAKNTPAPSQNAPVTTSTAGKDNIAPTPTDTGPEIAPTVVKTDKLLSRIDKRNLAGLVEKTNPYYQAPEDVGKVQSEGMKNEQLSIADQLKAEKEKYGVQYSANEDGTPTPDATTIKATQEADKAKVETDKIASDKALYDAKNLQKKEVDPINEDEAFSVLMSGGKLVPSEDNARVEQRFKTYQLTASKTAQQIADENVNGDISQNVLDNLAKYDKVKFDEVVKITEKGLKIEGINQATERLYNAATGKKGTDKPMTTLEKIQYDMDKIINSDAPSIRGMREKYLLDNEKIKKLKVQVARDDAKIEEIQDAMEYQYDDMRGEFPTVPKGILMGMVAAANKELNRSLTTAMRARNISFAEYTAEKEESNAAMQFEMQVVAEERATRTEQLSYLKDKFATAKSDADWERNKSYEEEKLKDAYAHQDATAAKLHENNLKLLELGQDFSAKESKLQRDQAMKIVNMQMVGSDVESNIIEDKDGNKIVVLRDKKTNKITKIPLDEMPTGGGMTTGNDGTPIVYGEDKNGNFTANFGPTGAVLARGQCAMPINDKTGFKMGNTISSKMQYTQKGRTAMVGDVFVSNEGKEIVDGEITGHTGFVKTVLPNGDIEVWESNYKTMDDGTPLTSTRIVTKAQQEKAKFNFGETKFTNVASDNPKSTNNDIFKNTATSLRNYQKAEWASASMMTDFTDMVKRNGAGSEGLKGFINTVANKKMGDKWKELQDGTTSLEDIQKSLKAYNAKFGVDGFGYVGNADKNIKDLQSKLNSGAYKPGDKVYEKIKMESQILQAMQTYRHSKTGAAASELESNEYIKLFPSGDDSVNTSLAKMEGLLNGVKAQKKSVLSDLLGGEENYNYFVKGIAGGQSSTLSIAGEIGNKNYSLADSTNKKTLDDITKNIFSY